MAHHGASQQPSSDTIHASLRGATKFQKMCQLKQQQDQQVRQTTSRSHSYNQIDTHTVEKAAYHTSKAAATQSSRPEEDREEEGPASRRRRPVIDSFHGPAPSPPQPKPVMVLRRCEDLDIRTSGFQRIEEESQRRPLDLRRHHKTAATTPRCPSSS